MRLPLRLTLIASAVTIILLLILKHHLEDLWDQYSVSSYISHKVQGADGSKNYLPPLPGIKGDKVIVMAKLETDNTDWVTNDLADWQSAIYTVNPTTPLLSNETSVPQNKGKESMAYLTYVIDHYDSLPAIITFLHSHEAGFLKAWHTDTPLHSNKDALRQLNLTFVQQNGYVNLRCNLNPGCLEAHTHNQHVTPDVYIDVFSGTSTAVNRTNSSNEDESTEDRTSDAPERVGQACCAQFAVSSERVRQRPKADYERLREWILDTEMSDAKSGRVMEFLWHVIFGMEAVYCPSEEKCYCNVYGRC